MIKNMHKNIRLVNRKFVIFVGKKTVNGICFNKGKSPDDFSQVTLDEKDTKRFFETGELDDQYLNKLIETINSFITIFCEEGKKEEISIYTASEFATSLTEDDIVYLKMRILKETGVHSFVLTKDLEQLYIRNIVPQCQRARWVVRIMSTATIAYFINEAGDVKAFRFERLGSAVLASLLQEIKEVRNQIKRKMDETVVIKCINKLKQEISKKINSQWKDLQSDIVIYLGGEINFLQSLKYELGENNIFSDKEHEYAITYDSFFKQSIDKVLRKTQKELNNEAVDLQISWKEGIKPCTLIAMALFQVLGVKIIIPSNKKELHGMYYKNFENIVITGSKKVNGEEIEKWIEYFNFRGINVYSPQIGNDTDVDEILEEARHLQAINRCDTLIVCNSGNDGYIGDSTLFDIGYALAKGKRVITTQEPSKDVFDLIAVEIGIYEES